MNIEWVERYKRMIQELYPNDGLLALYLERLIQYAKEETEETKTTKNINEEI